MDENSIYVKSVLTHHISLSPYEIENGVDETILEAGDFTQVKPGKVHQFEGIEDGVAFELYWAEFNHDDIVRRTAGTKVDKK